MPDLGTLFDFDSTLSPVSLLLSLAIGFVLSIVLRWHYHRFGSPFSDRRAFSAIFPFLVLTVTLIIAIVKSSLALSLGLVGALSIVRFRTPIKEPEELAYIFLAIAIGLGLGADQTIATITAGPAIMLLLAFFKMSRRKASQNLFLSINADQREAPVQVDELSSLVAACVDGCELRRVDMSKDTLQATYLVEAPDLGKVHALLNDIRQKHPGANVSLIDQYRVPGV
jgi:hypothetical protein